MDQDNSAFKNTLLADSCILYLQSNDNIRIETNNILQDFFHKIYLAKNTLEALSFFLNENLKIDLMILELNNESIVFMNEIRKSNLKIPILLCTSFSDIDILTKAIKFRISDYILMPMLVGTTLKIIFNILSEINNMKLINQQKNELENYKFAIDKQNMISKIDLKGNITYVNDLFCEVSSYSKDELIGKKYSILIHPDVSNDLIKEIWSRIRSGKRWISIVKNQSKNKSIFYTKVTIIPIFNLNNELIEFISMKYLINDVIEEKMNLKKLILKQKSASFIEYNENKHKRTNEVNSALNKNNKEHSININNLNELVEDLKNELKDVRSKYNKEKSRVLGLDDKIKNLEEKTIEHQKSYQSKLTQLNKISQAAVFKYDKIKKHEIILEDKYLKAQNTIEVLKNNNDEYKNKINNLSSKSRIR